MHTLRAISGDGRVPVFSHAEPDGIGRFPECGRHSWRYAVGSTAGFTLARNSSTSTRLFSE